MAAKKSGKRKRNYTTARQQAPVDNIPTSKTLAEAAIKGGYPAKNARQSAFQALQGMRGRVPNLMDQLGLSEQILIDKHLRQHLNAKRIHYFQKDGKVKDSRKTEALEIQSKALDMAFRFHGSYAPRDPKEAEQFGIKVVIIDVPRPPRHHPAIDVEPNGDGTPPTDNNMIAATPELLKIYTQPNLIPVGPKGIYSSLEQHNVKAKVLKVDPFYDDLRSFGAMASLQLAFVTRTF